MSKIHSPPHRSFWLTSCRKGIVPIGVADANTLEDSGTLKLSPELSRERRKASCGLPWVQFGHQLHSRSRLWSTNKPYVVLLATPEKVTPPLLGRWYPKDVPETCRIPRDILGKRQYRISAGPEAVVGLRSFFPLLSTNDPDGNGTRRINLSMKRPSSSVRDKPNSLLWSRNSRLISKKYCVPKTNRANSPTGSNNCSKSSKSLRCMKVWTRILKHPFYIWVPQLP